jgi:predicted amidophosphoribosyltransferase
LTRCSKCLQEVPPTFNVCPRCGFEIASLEVKPETKPKVKDRQKFRKSKTQNIRKIQSAKIDYTL